MTMQAQVVDALNAFRKRLQCSICMSLCIAPTLLPCSHFFCRRCVSALVAAANAEHAASASAFVQPRRRVGEFDCPECRTRTTQRQTLPDETLAEVTALFTELRAAIEDEEGLQLSQDVPLTTHRIPAPNNSPPRAPHAVTSSHARRKVRRAHTIHPARPSYRCSFPSLPVSHVSIVPASLHHSVPARRPRDDGRLSGDPDEPHQPPWTTAWMKTQKRRRNTTTRRRHSCSTTSRPLSRPPHSCLHPPPVFHAHPGPLACPPRRPRSTRGPQSLHPPADHPLSLPSSLRLLTRPPLRPRRLLRSGPSTPICLPPLSHRSPR